jgi:hypothetical protein
VNLHVSRNRRSTLLILVAIAVTLLALGCARQPPPSGGQGPVNGFFTGLLHGFLIFFNLIASIFTDVRIYAFPNVGFWYDAGYVIGASIFWGGSGAGANSSRRKR